MSKNVTRRKDSRAAAHPLRIARLRAGMTLAEVGDAVGVGRAAVHKWEQGECLPRPAAAAGLVQLLPGLTVEALYGIRKAA